MTQPGTGASTAARVAAGGGRLVRAWRALPPERRVAAALALALFVCLFLPWYQETIVAAGIKQPVGASVTGWGAFSAVEAAVLLVAAGVLLLLFRRAEGKTFYLPGGDGGVIMAAGAWTCLLIVWRIFDKQSVEIHGPGTSISGIEWGIFAALAVAAGLTYSGSRIRAAQRVGEVPADRSRLRDDSPEPASAAVPAADSAPVTIEDHRPATATATAAGTRRRPAPPVSDEQLKIPLDD